MEKLGVGHEFGVGLVFDADGLFALEEDFDDLLFDKNVQIWIWETESAWGLPGTNSTKLTISTLNLWMDVSMCRILTASI